MPSFNSLSPIYLNITLLLFTLESYHHKHNDPYRNCCFELMTIDLNFSSILSFFLSFKNFELWSIQQVSRSLVAKTGEAACPFGNVNLSPVGYIFDFITLSENVNGFCFKQGDPSHQMICRRQRNFTSAQKYVAYYIIIN